jgi:ABC-type multidrug transport system fused ATPase/permease subunit
MARKKIRELTAEDFPGIDEQKLNEWKAAVQSANNATIVVLILLVIINIITLAVAQTFILGGLLLFLVIALINIKQNKLFKQLGITRKDVRRALRGEKVQVNR